MATSTQVHTSEGGFNRASIHQIGIWLFFSSELFLFGALVSTRYYLRGFETPEHVDQLLGLALTAILLLSSLSAYRAETAIAHGAHKQFVRNLLLTIVFGVLFMVGVGVEWYEAFEYFPPSSAYGTVFFTTTARLGPGEAAPVAHTAAMANQEPGSMAARLEQLSVTR